MVKATAGSIVTITITGTASAGSLTINDCATTGAAAAANQVVSIPSTSLTSPVLFLGGFVTTTGIVISAVPTGATVGIAFA